jgi:hypothetical protein
LRCLIDSGLLGVVLIGLQPPPGFEPVFVGPPYGPAALLPKPICEFPLLPYIQLRAHDSSPSVFLEPTIVAEGCTAYARRSSV